MAKEVLLVSSANKRKKLIEWLCCNGKC